MKKEPTTRNGCGQPSGRYQHRRAGEHMCTPCRESRNAEQRERRRAAAPQGPPPGSDELIEEIRFMMSLRQGHAYILRAVGYTGREAALKNRLQRHGCLDVYNDLMGIDPEDQPGPNPLSRRGLLRA